MDSYKTHGILKTCRRIAAGIITTDPNPTFFVWNDLILLKALPNGVFNPLLPYHGRTIAGAWPGVVGTGTKVVERRVKVRY
ncbi:hypothetical protein [Arcticibacter tournemirensis]|uniref:hypothetical protein n=1 Tax=Arcticibacter tournemirensis TaxID=699437 RepID=UPI0011533047|nr:hypothetical protein [Arcticibacter tournemirensis]